MRYFKRAIYATEKWEREPRRFLSHFQTSINERIIPRDKVLREEMFCCGILNGISLSSV